MKIRGKFIVPIAGLMIVAVLVAVVSFNFTVRDLVTTNSKAAKELALKNIATEASARKDIIVGGIAEVGQKALALSTLFTKIPSVMTAYRLSLMGDINDENDRDMQMGMMPAKLAHMMINI